MVMRNSEAKMNAAGAGAEGGRRPTVVPAPAAAAPELSDRPRRRASTTGVFRNRGPRAAQDRHASRIELALLTFGTRAKGPPGDPQRASGPCLVKPVSALRAMQRGFDERDSRAV
jgi:hypothetical protein